MSLINLVVHNPLPKVNHARSPALAQNEIRVSSSAPSGSLAGDTKTRGLNVTYDVSTIFLIGTLRDNLHSQPGKRVIRPIQGRN